MKMNRIIPPVLLLLSVLTACSPLARHHALSFFFDGVPLADTTETPVEMQQHESMTAPDSSIVIQRNSYAYHQPYQRKQCVACHNENAVGSLVRQEPELCYSCHENFNTQFASLHGPVDAGFCSSCHDPHMSREKYLLKTAGNALCTICHLAEEVRQPPEHADIGKALCISCHDPHTSKVFRKKPIPIRLER